LKLVREGLRKRIFCSEGYVSSMSKVFSFEDTMKYIEFIKSNVDKRWLSEQLQIIDSCKPKNLSRLAFIDYAEAHFHPLAYLIYLVNKQLRKSFENMFFEVTEQILKLTLIGETLYILTLNNATNLDKKIKELMSSDKKYF
jgi:hypothetical protein